jgi:hypothetical protein
MANRGDDPALIDKHCPFGAPQKMPTLERGPTLVIARQAYALEHDAAAKIALGVCGSLDPALVFGTAQRRDPWAADPELQGKPRAVDADYKHSGFQRGSHGRVGGSRRLAGIERPSFSRMRCLRMALSMADNGRNWRPRFASGSKTGW